MYKGARPIRAAKPARLRMPGEDTCCCFLFSDMIVCLLCLLFA